MFRLGFHSCVVFPQTIVFKQMKNKACPVSLLCPQTRQRSLIPQKIFYFYFYFGMGQEIALFSKPGEGCVPRALALLNTPKRFILNYP